ncbi:hypothetical protein RI129_001771 [Pyrocoelia pectoralis]|uniref:THAP-type domain-containing protein n=1 Tax=Pyrocoelia pectoralis TaxID=417401 RepID=A0AAN7VL94_9COLE
MTNCCVYRCTNNPNKNKDLSFHSFPNKKTRGKVYKRWLLKINRDRFKPSNRSVVCSAHFLETDYEKTSILRKKLMPNYRNKLVLKKDAVPSVGMRGETDLQTQEQSRRQSNYQKMKETIHHRTYKNKNKTLKKYKRKMEGLIFSKKICIN